MVEFGRLAQIDGLQAKGWYTDAETEQFEAMTLRQGLIGSPTYLKNPDDHLLYECSGGTQRLVDGPQALIDDPDLGERYTFYRDGRATFAQG
jgi:hypothetical protein